MKKNILFIILFFLIAPFTYAQDGTSDTTAVVVEKDKPVKSPFESGYLIDAQTTVIQPAHTLEAIIQHKFGTIQNGHSDLWGIYAPGANIRLGLNYVFLKNFQVGAGIVKKNMASDLDVKWTLMQQTRKNTYPVAITIFGNVAVDGRNIKEFESGNVQVAHELGQVNLFKWPDRLSYFSELIVSRKFSEKLTLQTAISFTHYNVVGLVYDHDNVALHLSGRFKVSPQGSLIFNYDFPLKIKDISEQWKFTNPPKQNLSFGYEVATSAHSFQIYMGTYSGILPQDNTMWNQNDLTKQQFVMGFVITRLWGF
jgi:Membrane bound beta barrel domain (DUF5777)